MDCNEAIKILIEKQHEWEEYGVTDLAIEALEKQIPKKPIKHSIIRNEQTWICPTCNRLYWDKEFLSDYCSSCGQKLDLD